MSEENENLIGGFYPKKGDVDFVKCKLGINKKQFVEWYKQQDKDEEWINIDIKVSKKGNWYAEKNNWKPDQDKNKPNNNAQVEGDDDTIPF
tara:strand:- start:337 stop:609 length:273 start_codon:yes stop_codon:yes gene_type:complete